MLVFTESEHPRLTKREVLFEDFQPKCHQYTSTSVKDRQTDGQTTCRSNTALCVSIARWRQSLNENFLNPKYCDAFPKCIVRVQPKESICPFSATHFQDFIIDVHSRVTNVTCSTPSSAGSSCFLVDRMAVWFRRYLLFILDWVQPVSRPLVLHLVPKT